MKAMIFSKSAVKFIAVILATLVFTSLFMLIVSAEFAIEAAGEVQTVQTTGRKYYVSQSEGNDSNDGRSPSSPWQTLHKVSSETFEPGDEVLLRRGDTWNKEVLYLNANSAGNRNWVSLQAYGDTALDRPKIFPGAGSKYSILIYNNNLSIRNCGWKINDIEVGYAMNGIYMLDQRKGVTDADGQLDGLWIENCYIHDITGNPFNPFSFPDYLSSGIRTYSEESRIHHVTLKNNTFARCDVGMSGWSLNYFLIEKNAVNYSNFHGIEFCMASNGVIQDCAILHSGQAGHPTGTAGVEFDSLTDNIMIRNCEIAYTVSPNNSPDGCGLDFEGLTNNIVAENNHIHDNAGRAFLMMVNNTNSKMIGNRCYNNGTDTDRLPEPAFLAMWGNGDNGGEISGNVIGRANSGQYINYVDNIGTDSFKLNGFTCFGNTITGSEPPDPTPPPVIHPDPRPHTWDFSMNGNTDGWRATNDMSKLVSDNGILSASVTGIDPYMVSGNSLNVHITDNKIIKVKLKNNSGSNRAELFFTTEADGKFDTVKHKIFNIVPNDPNFTEYEIDMSDLPGFTGTLKQLRIDPAMDVLSGSFSIDYVDVGSENPYSFEFGTDDDTEGWWLQNQIDSFSTDSGYLNGTVTGNDPYIVSGDWMGVSSKNSIIKIKLKNDTDADTARIFFTTNTDGCFDETKCKSFSIRPNDPRYTEYEIDMSDLPGFAGTIRRIRIDPAVNAAGTFSIDYIRLGKPSPCDLVITSIGTDPEIKYDGDDIKIYAVVRNISSNPSAGNFNVDFSIDGIYLQTVVHQPIPANGMAVVPATVHWKAWFGSHKIRAVLNGDKSTEETNYGNNKLQMRVSVIDDISPNKNQE